MTVTVESQRAQISLPWNAWYADQTETLAVPGGWSIEIVPGCSLPGLSPGQIHSALAAPIDSPTLAELARGARRVAVVVDDLARPTRAADILPAVFAELAAAGVSSDAVRIVMATGAHGPPDSLGLIAKVGAGPCAAGQVEIHDPRGELVDTGIPYGDRTLRVNRTFFEADLKLGIGSALPHPFAGFSGGAKLLLPGLTDLAATDRSHKFVRLGLRGGTDPNANGFRREIEQIARQLGYTFTICCVPNIRRETAGLFAGDVVSAHRAASTLAATELAAQVPDPETCDCLFLNAYPKDVDLVQSEGALVALKRVGRAPVREGGIVVLTTAATQGLGDHGLFSPGGLAYRAPTRRRDLNHCEFWVYSPSLTEHQVHQLFWPGTRCFQSAEGLCQALRETLGERARAVVIPSAPLQPLFL